MDRAACKGMDPEVFHPGQGGGVAVAKEVCATCAVRAECLDYAVHAREPFGIWGGATVKERKALRRTARKAPRPKTPRPKASSGDHVVERQRRIAELTDEGLTGRAIADTLGIPLHMVYDARRYS